MAAPVAAEDQSEDELSNLLAALLHDSASCSPPSPRPTSSLSSFLSRAPRHHQYDFPHILRCFVRSLPHQSASCLWLLHTRQIVRLESLLHALAETAREAAAPAEPADSSSTPLDRALQPMVQLLTAEFAASPARSITDCAAPSAVLSLLRACIALAAASIQDDADSIPCEAREAEGEEAAVRLPLLSLFPQSCQCAAAVLRLLFLSSSSQPLSQALRQTLLVQVVSMRPVQSRGRLLELCLHWSLGQQAAVSTQQLQPILSFLLAHIPSARLLPCYLQSLRDAEADASGESVAAHRLWLQLLLRPPVDRLRVPAAGPALHPALLAALSDRLHCAVERADVTATVAMLRLARCCVQLVPARALSGAAAAEDGPLPRDWSSWLDTQLPLLLGDDGLQEEQEGQSGAKGKKRKRERFVLKGKRASGGKQRQHELPEASAASLLAAEVEVEMEMERSWLQQEGLDAGESDSKPAKEQSGDGEQRPLQSSRPSPRRQTRQTEGGAEGDNDSEAAGEEQQRLHRLQADLRRRAARRSRLLLLLQAMTPHAAC